MSSKHKKSRSPRHHLPESIIPRLKLSSVHVKRRRSSRRSRSGGKKRDKKSVLVRRGKTEKSEKRKALSDDTRPRRIGKKTDESLTYYRSPEPHVSKSACSSSSAYSSSSSSSIGHLDLLSRSLVSMSYTTCIFTQLDILDPSSSCRNNIEMASFCRSSDYIWAIHDQRKNIVAFIWWPDNIDENITRRYTDGRRFPPKVLVPRALSYAFQEMCSIEALRGGEFDCFMAYPTSLVSRGPRCSFMVYDLAPYGDFVTYYNKIMFHLTKRRKEQIACQVVYQVMCLLVFIHGRNWAHRDIKPDNILVMYSDYMEPELQILGPFIWIKVGDWEYACSCSPGPADRPGSVEYAAPEVLSPKGSRMFDSCNPQQCDIFSVGVLVYLILTCHIPKNWSDLNLALLYGYPSDVKDFVSAACSLDSSKRPSILELLNFSWLKRQAIILLKYQSTAEFTPPMGTYYRRYLSLARDFADHASSLIQ